MSARRRSPSARRHRPGTAPGTLVADPRAHAGTVRLIAYDGETIEEVADAGLADIGRARDRGLRLWVDVGGLADIGLIEKIGEAFDLHPLALEDVVNTHQRPKAEEFDDHLFVVTRIPVGAHDTDIRTAETEQISIFVGRAFVLTFRERPDDCFEPVRARLRQAKGRLRESGPDYLMYCLVDTAADTFFPMLEAYGERLEDLETRVALKAPPGTIEDIHRIKRDMLAIRRALWPQREMINSLIRDESPLVEPATKIYLRDCYDHAVQLMDILETHREIASSLVDIYLSTVSARLNEIMKVLTTIATIFIPLSFIASVYGMNFDRDVSPWNMPELGWRFGYLFALGLMLATATGLIWYLRRRHWIGKDRRKP